MVARAHLGLMIAGTAQRTARDPVSLPVRVTVTSARARMSSVAPAVKDRAPTVAACARIPNTKYANQSAACEPGANWLFVLVWL